MSLGKVHYALKIHYEKYTLDNKNFKSLKKKFFPKINHLKV